MQEQQEMWKYKGREINNNINKQGLWTFGEWYRKNFEGKKNSDTKHLTPTEILPPQVMQKKHSLQSAEKTNSVRNISGLLYFLKETQMRS